LELCDSISPRRKRATLNGQEIWTTARLCKYFLGGVQKVYYVSPTTFCCFRSRISTSCIVFQGYFWSLLIEITTDSSGELYSDQCDCEIRISECWTKLNEVKRYNASYFQCNFFANRPQFFFHSNTFPIMYPVIANVWFYIKQKRSMINLYAISIL